MRRRLGGAGESVREHGGRLAAIRFARESRRPFLGTCGGFQHAAIEFARNVAGLPSADHAETNPAADDLVVKPLTCSLVETLGRIHFSPGSRLREIYAADSAEEGYHCSYGVNPAYRPRLERAGLRFTAFASVGDCGSAANLDEIRGVELPPDRHPFFIATLFQPERAALCGQTPPIVRAFVAAAARD